MGCRNCSEYECWRKQVSEFLLFSGWPATIGGCRLKRSAWERRPDTAPDRPDDTALWRVARQKYVRREMSDYQLLPDKNAEGTISEAESEKLKSLRTESDRLMLLRAHAVALLRWRGYQIPPAEQLQEIYERIFDLGFAKAVDGKQDRVMHAFQTAYCQAIRSAPAVLSWIRTSCK